MPNADKAAGAASTGEPLASIGHRPTRRRYRVIALLCAMYLITYMDRTNLSIIAPLISKEFNFDKLTMGFIFSAFSWSYTIFQMPCGYLGDRYGPRRMLGTFALYWSVLTAMIIAARTATGFWLARFFFGIGEAGAFPTATRAMTFWVPASERGFAQGFTHAFSRLGSALTPPLTVWVARRWGWRAAFIFFAAAGGAWAILWLLTYHDRPEQDGKVNDGELAVIRGELSHGGAARLERHSQPEASNPRPGKVGVPWASVLGSPNMWA